jgi:hypothetical protein
VTRRRGVRFVGAGLAAVTVIGTATGAGLVATASVALAATSGPAAVSHPAAVTGITRISGSSRIDTAIATSKDEFPGAGTASAVVLARSDTFPDALAGGPLAAKVGGPLLLTSPTALDASVLAEIKRVAPAGATVYILGGTSAIKSTVDASLTGAGYVPKRIFGADRFATAVAIADAMGDPTTVFEATGLNFPDALAGGPAAISEGGVILLTNGSAQAPATAAYLTAHSGGTHYALGGPAAAADPAATALVGDDRYWTAVNVAIQFFDGASIVGAATGLNFPDALAAGPDLASKHAPLILVPAKGALPDGVTTHLLFESPTLTSGLVFGGTASLGDDVAGELGTLITAHARAVAADTSTAFSGAFGVLAENINLAGLTGTQTAVVDAATGDATLYKKGSTTQTEPAAFPPRSQLAALPTDFDGLEAAINSLYASIDADQGIPTDDAQAAFTFNAEFVLLNPVTPPSVRLAVYAALAADDAYTDVTSGVKDSLGRTGIEIFMPTGETDASKSKLSYIFDPNTFLPLEDTVTDDAGAVVTRTTITSLTTTATAPANPY